MDTPYLKQSFAPLSTPESRILVLGSLPGDTSLLLNEYYGHPRNRFWKVISEITGYRFPGSYDEKKALLAQTRIAVWDVAHKAVRKGSLDTAIEQEEPNNLEPFILAHRNLKTVAFNGQKAEKLFDKYFDRKPDIRYLSLPSTSPANAAISFENLCKAWSRLLDGPVTQ